MLSKRKKPAMAMFTMHRRAFLHSPSSASVKKTPAALLSAAQMQSNRPSLSYLVNRSDPTTSDRFPLNIHPNDIISQFRDWFMSRRNPIFDRVFQIIRTHDDASTDAALSRLNLSLSEALILDLLSYQKNDILSCLKLFDWAGRQPGFHHTRATFNAIFRILSKAKLMSVLLDFLQNYMKQRYTYKVRYVNVLVIGYAIAGKPETALQLFGRMRFQGHDLDGFAYHVLMNSLVEEGYFDVVETMANQVRTRGYQNEFTHSIVIKSYCKQNELEKGEAYLRALAADNRAELNGGAVSTYVDALCKDHQFERAALIVEEFRRMGFVSMEQAYDAWIVSLIRVGKLDGALEFLKDKQAVEGYVPDVFRYNILICRLLRENRLEEVYDLLEEMKESEIAPDNITMNAIMCFLCKVGRMDIAMGLYNSREEFGLSVNCMTYNYLINTLLGDGSVDEAYPMLRNYVEQGYLPGLKTLSIIGDALCREGKLDKMKELVLFALDRDIMPNNFVCKFISALCRVRRVEEGYLMHSLLNRLNKPSQRSAYESLINGFSKSSRGDVAARLLIEMQEKGYSPTRKLVRDVICCLCRMDDPETQFFRLLEMLLVHQESSRPRIYNNFIYGAGQAKKPEFAIQVYELMGRTGLKPDFKSEILLLNSYLCSGNTAHALHLFHGLSMRRKKRKLWHTMIIGLCKAKRPELASQILEKMMANKLRPTIECYEELIKLYCELGHYDKAVDTVNNMIRIGRPVSSFIGNVFLLHALKGRKLYDAWSYASHKQNLPPVSWMLGHVIGVFSGCVEERYNIEDVEKLIEQCFPIDIYTNNMLLRRLSVKGMDFACNFFDKLVDKGYEPNKWTYDIIVHGLAKVGRTAEAKIWMEEMVNRGFELTEITGKMM
ncbi:pentatricopeptide repeat-containing protein At1g71210, mitochondrial-like [Primulina huaijiensis]|uniref:pentatricopeptide repeat-containing protein At1g71210, mitochondrial-like n=1 Tax=Primulina huaijiensis TaxID=1492673 RepID=UPI003CC72D4B